MLIALYIMLSLALIIGSALGVSALLFKVKSKPLLAEIDALLPQTQCQKCGYSGCKPYAQALANGEAQTNQCPPGGDVGARALADLLGVEYQPVNTAHGLPKAKAVALIDEASCIGCTLCIQACPVDAILGASKQMHTVIAAECTGCELCLPPCPVDCISMPVVAENLDNFKWKHPLIPIQALPNAWPHKAA
jgi:electron transport complex protein RnfB